MPFLMVNGGCVQRFGGTAPGDQHRDQAAQENAQVGQKVVCAYLMHCFLRLRPLLQAQELS